MVERSRASISRFSRSCSRSRVWTHVMPKKSFLFAHAWLVRINFGPRINSTRSSDDVMRAQCMANAWRHRVSSHSLSRWTADLLLSEGWTVTEAIQRSMYERPKSGSVGRLLTPKSVINGGHTRRMTSSTQPMEDKTRGLKWEILFRIKFCNNIMLLKNDYE